MNWIKDQRAKLRMWNEERKQKAAEKRAERQVAASRDQHAHSRFFLLTVPTVATICAATVEWYWAILFCIAATGKLGFAWATASGSAEPTSGSWHFEWSIIDASVLAGLILATLPIVMLSLVWLPVQFAMRGAGRWRRGTLIVVGILANILVIVSGTVVMNINRQEQVRSELVVEQTAGAQRAMLQASVEDLQGELATLMNHRSTYVATAASVGAVAYERDYVAQARATGDARLPLLERALGSARRADELRSQISAARQAVATAAPEAATQANVRDDIGAGLNTFAQVVEVYRPPFVALICTLIGIFGTWWVVALLDGLNPRDVLRSGWADEAHRIEDHSAEAPLPVDPRGPVPPREVVTDAETGEELIRITPKPHWRKTKGKKQTVQTTPDIPPDETGVQEDGGGRIGSVVAPTGEALTALTEEANEDQAEQKTNADGHDDGGQDVVTQEQSSEPSQEYLDAVLSLETDTPVLPENQEQQQDDGAEPDQQSEQATLTEEEPQPITDERRLLAAK